MSAQHREFFCDSDTPRFPPLLPSLPFSTSRMSTGPLPRSCLRPSATSSPTGCSFRKCGSSAATVPWLDAAAEWNSYSVFSLDRASAVLASRGRLLSPYVRTAAQMYAHICSPGSIPLPWLPFHLPGYGRRETEREEETLGNDPHKQETPLLGVTEHVTQPAGSARGGAQSLADENGVKKTVPTSSQTQREEMIDGLGKEGRGREARDTITADRAARCSSSAFRGGQGEGDLSLSQRLLLLDLSEQSSAFFSWKRDFDAAVRLHARFMVFSANLLLSPPSSSCVETSGQHRAPLLDENENAACCSSSLFYCPSLSSCSSSSSLCFSLLDLAFLAPRVNTSLCGSVLPALWASAGPTLRRAFTKALAVFLANPAHLQIPFLVSLPPAQQVQQHHHLLSVHAGSSSCGGGGAGGAAVVQPLLATLLKCSPMPVLPADLLCYLAKTYNCRHEALLLLEHAYLSAFAESIAPRSSEDKEAELLERKGAGELVVSERRPREESEAGLGQEETNQAEKT